MLRLPWPVDHTAHHRNLEVLNPRVQRTPLGQACLEVGLNLLGHLLEEGARCPSASRTRGHLRREGAKTERLQNLLRDFNLKRAIRPWLWRQ